MIKWGAIRHAQSPHYAATCYSAKDHCPSRPVAPALPRAQQALTQAAQAAARADPAAHRRVAALPVAEQAWAAAVPAVGPEVAAGPQAVPVLSSAAGLAAGAAATAAWR